MDKPLFQHLTVSDLTVQFMTKNGMIQPVDGVSFEIRHGEHVGLIGESGCGKTVTALSLLGFERGKPGIVAGKIELNGNDILPDWNKLFGKVKRAGSVLSKKSDSKGLITEIAKRKQKRWRKWQRALSACVSSFRGSVISLAFQDATKMLDPLFTIGKQLTEAVVLSDPAKKWSAADKRKEACKQLRQVEMPDPDEVFFQYPHQLSGGMLQRVVLAIALASKPSLLIADEPTTGLDVTVGSKILLLLKKRCREEGLTLLVISHDLAVIRELTDKVIVMYAGQIVESLKFEKLEDGCKSLNPQHPYTQALMDAQITDEDIDSDQLLRAIPREVPKPEDVISGCRFHPRCPLMEKKEEAGDDEFVKRCRSQPPDLYLVTGHGVVRCWKFHNREALESMNPNQMLLHAENLKKYFAPRQGIRERVQTTFSQWKSMKKPFKTLWALNSQPVHAVDGVSLSIAPKEIVGLVGESGSGKTTLGRLLARLISSTAGQIMFDGAEITNLGRAEMRQHRRSIRMMFQKPTAILNPDLTIRQILVEAIDMHPDGWESDGSDGELVEISHSGTSPTSDREAKLRKLLEMVNLPPENLEKFPADLSGGLLRRVAIARTLVGKPKLIIADEPVAGLDVSIQAQIINLMKQINEKQQVAYLLISHNLQVVRYLSSRIMVMYRGRIVEEGLADEISTQKACHPYTQDLLKSAKYYLASMKSIKSTAPEDGQNLGCPYRFDGCHLYESDTVNRRCCEKKKPKLKLASNTSKMHKVACHHV